MTRKLVDPLWMGPAGGKLAFDLMTTSKLKTYVERFNADDEEEVDFVKGMIR